MTIGEAAATKPVCDMDWLNDQIDVIRAEKVSNGLPTDNIDILKVKCNALHDAYKAELVKGVDSVSYESLACQCLNLVSKKFQKELNFECTINRHFGDQTLQEVVNVCNCNALLINECITQSNMDNLWFHL